MPSLQVTGPPVPEELLDEVELPAAGAAAAGAALLVEPPPAGADLLMPP